VEINNRCPAVVAVARIAKIRHFKKQVNNVYVLDMARPTSISAHCFYR
jgi:hypothetical protein